MTQDRNLAPAVLAALLLPSAAWANAVPLRLDATLDSGPATIQFEAGEVASATVEPGPDGEPLLRIKVAVDRRADLELFTTDALNQEVVVTVCGEVVARPLLLDPVSNGVFDLWNVAPGAAGRAAAALTGAAPCGGP